MAAALPSGPTDALYLAVANLSAATMICAAAPAGASANAKRPSSSETVVRKSNPGPCVAAPDHPDAVPRLFDTDAEAMAGAIKPGGSLGTTVDGLKLRFPLPRLAAAMVSRMDGKRTLGAIHEELRGANRDLDWDAFSVQFRQLYTALNGIGKLFLSVQRRRV